MATPRFVKFSRAPGTPEDVLTRLEFRLLGPSGLEYARFAALKPVEDPDDFAYTGGLDLAGEMVPVAASRRRFRWRANGPPGGSPSWYGKFQRT
jgi:hypothetical protein